MVEVGEVVYERVVVRRQEVRLEEGLGCLVGPSGLGKSTFLKQLLKALRWPYVPQEPRLPGYARLWHVAEYLAKKNRCVPPKEFLRGFVEIARALGIGNKLYSKVSQLSAGERQRAFVALQLARGCKRLLADEPASQLDPWNAVKVMKEIKERTEIALVVTHDVVTMSFCDTFYTLKDGYFVKVEPEQVGVFPSGGAICFEHSKAKVFKPLSNSSSTSSGEVW